MTTHEITRDLESISPTFYAQFLHQQVYANLTSVRCRVYSVEVYLAVHTSKVRQICVGETEQCRKMTTGAFALCARRLVKLTP